MKGTLGSVSTVGVVPACASLDCLTVFARSVADGAMLMQIMRSASAPLDVWRREPVQVGVCVDVHDAGGEKGCVPECAPGRLCTWRVAAQTYGQLHRLLCLICIQPGGQSQ